MNRAAHSLLRTAALCSTFLLPAIASSQAPAMPAMAHEMAPPSTSLTLTIEGKATVLTIADLQAMPQKTVAVKNEHTKLDESYSGVMLGDLLAKYGFPVDKTTHRKMLRSYVVATGTDKYWVLYSATEIEASEHNGEAIVAIAKDGKPLTEDGQIKLVASGDKRPVRWVRNLTAITLKSAE